VGDLHGHGARGDGRSAALSAAPPDNRQILPREAHLACGGSLVGLPSGFRIEDAAANELRALFQVLTVQSAVGRAKTFFMAYQPHPDDDGSMVVSLDCLQNPATNKFAIALTSTNFGNCDSCVWTDLFSEDGEVLSLGPTPFGPVNVDRRHVRRKPPAAYPDAPGQVVASVNISRAIEDRRRR
jgi:hypothetical protein